MVMDLNCNEEAKIVALVCRLCLNAADASYPVSYLNGLLSDIIPDLDFSLSKDPVVCMSCVNLVTASFNLKKMCLETERKVRDYYEVTSNPVNLYTLVATHQVSNIISNVPKNDFHDHCAKNSIWKIQSHKTCDDSSSKLKKINSIISIDQAEQSKKNENRKTIFEPKLENIERISKNNTETKDLSCLEENEHIVRIEEPPGAEDSEVPNYNMSEVVEIVESDINSDVELEFSEDEDIISFKEFCCQEANVNDQEYGKEGLLNKFETEDEDCIQIVDHEVESDVSDMIVIEEFNQGSCNTGKKKVEEKIDTKHVMVTDEKTTSFSLKKSPQSNNILSENDSSQIFPKIRRGQLCQRVKRNLFICVLCCKEFTQKIQVNRHLLTTHKDIPDIELKVDSRIHFCQFCSYHTLNKPNLAVHLARTHNKKVTKEKTASSSPNKFPQSNNRLSENGSKISRNLSRSKLCRRINKKPFICMICRKSFARKHHLASHLLSKHKDIADIESEVDSRIHLCQFCSYHTVNKPNLAVHLARTHNRVTKEKTASFSPNKSPQSNNILSENYSKISTKIPRGQLCQRVKKNLFICVICCKEFTRKIQVNRHLLTTHKDIPDIKTKVDSKMHFCQFCSYHTIDKPNLAVHLANIHNKILYKSPQSSRGKLCRRINKKLFMCLICCKQFTQKLHVNSHLLSKHKDIPNIEKKVDSKIHFCKYCSYRTLSTISLTKHINRHMKRNTMYKHQFKEYFCAHCPYSTENKGNLVIHVRIHSLHKFFQC